MSSDYESKVAPARWESVQETAPSTLRPDEPRLARWIGSVGLLFIALAFFAWLFAMRTGESRIGPGTRIFLLATGLMGVLFHASRDTDLQMRRTYGLVGLLLLIVSGALASIRIGDTVGALFLPYGYLCLPLALLFLMAYAHNETEVTWRWPVLVIIGVVALILSGMTFIGGNVSAPFLLRYGLLFGLVGLAYGWAFIGLEGSDSPAGFRAALIVGAIGLAGFLVALGRSLMPLFGRWFSSARAPAEQPYIASAGLLLMIVGLLYLGLAVGICSDNRLVVLTRRELSAFFYSPIAYIVLFGWTIVGFYMFWVFTDYINAMSLQGQGVIEPIVRFYFIDFDPVMAILFVIPILTMRLLSEERRTGTLEVLLTAPLEETSIVLSKFFGALFFFLLMWIPWGLFLIALRIEGARTFDYRPLLSFSVGLACSGASFISMGLFFSSLTRNQIIAAILTFAGMMLLITAFFVSQLMPTGAVRSLLTHASFINLWQDTLEGKLIPRDLLFPLSATAFWLFLTVKSLEARKWS
jgi:ABC-type transport system involved in multi-copper enzyme maturation permease subunit